MTGILGRAEEEIAREFHDAYERLAPEYDYKTREESHKPWAEVPAKNKALMVAVIESLLADGVIAPGQTKGAREARQRLTNVQPFPPQKQS